MKKTSKNNNRARKQRVGKGSAAPSNKQKTLAIVTPPVNMGAVYKNLGPKGLGSAFRVSHTELFTSVQTGPSNSNRCYGFRIQPTDTSMFPWLSQIADRFDKYRFAALTYTYTPIQGTATPGVVAMAIDYDPHDLAPVTADQDGRQQIMSHVNAQQHPIWQPFSLTIPSSTLQKAGERWVRNWEGEEQVEARTADLGVLYFGVFGTDHRDAVPQTVTSTWIGDLTVSYTVELLMPQLNRPTEQSGPEVINITELFDEATPRPSADQTIEPLGERDCLDGTSPLTPKLGTSIHGTTEVATVGPELVEHKIISTPGFEMGVLEVKDDFEGVIEVELHTLPKNPLTEDEPTRPFDLLSLKQLGDTQTYEIVQLSPQGDGGAAAYGNVQDTVTPTMWNEIVEIFEDHTLEFGAVIKRYVWQCVGSWVKGQLLSLIYGSMAPMIGYSMARIRAAPRSEIPRIELARIRSTRNIESCKQTLQVSTLYDHKHPSRVPEQIRSVPSLSRTMPRPQNPPSHRITIPASSRFGKGNFENKRPN